MPALGEIDPLRDAVWDGQRWISRWEYQKYSQYQQAALQQQMAQQQMLAQRALQGGVTAGSQYYTPIGVGVGGGAGGRTDSSAPNPPATAKKPKRALLLLKGK